MSEEGATTLPHASISSVGVGLWHDPRRATAQGALKSGGGGGFALGRGLPAARREQALLRVEYDEE